MSRASVAVMVLSVAGLSAQVSGARAQQCSDDTGCPTGFECQVTGVSSACSGGAPAPTPSCPPDQKCDLPAQPLPPTTCTTLEYRSCVPRACTNDSECAAGMVCHTPNADCPVTSQDPAVCKDGICPPREPPPECKVRQQCVPRYLLPCELASDCGEGFTCEAQKRCGCSASGTEPSAGAAPVPAQDSGQADREPADAGAPADLRAPAPPPDCTCEVTAEKYCKAVEVVCQADADCPGDFTCQVTATSGSSGGAGGAGGAFACDPAFGADGGVCGVARPNPTPVVERRCVPPYDGVAVDLGGHGEPDRGETAAGGKGSIDQSAGPAAPPNALPTGDSAKPHARACSAIGPGTHGTSGVSLWASLLTLAAAMLVTRRRR